MAVFTPVVLSHQKRRDGTYPVKIRVCFKTKVAYIGTTLVAYADDLTKPKKGAPRIKSLELLSKANSIIKGFNESLETMSYEEMQSMDIKALVQHLSDKDKEKNFSLDIIKYLRDRVEEAPMGTKCCYYSTASALVRYTGRDSLDINDITTGFLRGFSAFLLNEPDMRSNKGELPTKTVGKTSLYLKKLKAAYNAARNEYNEPDIDLYRIPKNPWEYFKIPTYIPCDHRDKSVDFIQKMINVRNECPKTWREHIDVYLLSFTLLGMNLVDLYLADTLLPGNVIAYERSKTKRGLAKKMVIYAKIENEILPIAKHLFSQNDERVFDLKRLHSNTRAFVLAAKRIFDKYAERYNEAPFTMYSARHSWATIAANECDVRMEIIHQALGHAATPGMQMTDIYVNKDWSAVAKANRKVMDLFDWSPVSQYVFDY